MHLYKPHSKTACIDMLKPGNVLVSQSFLDNELLDRSVILLLEHDETGSTGVILNKSDYRSRSLSLLTNKYIGYGGNYDTHRIGFIHTLENIPRSIRISEGVYFSENSDEIEEIVSSNRYDLRMIKAFVGFTVWEAGELEKEIKENRWCINEFNMSELGMLGDNEIWGYKLLRSGNIYGLFYDMVTPSFN